MTFWVGRALSAWLALVILVDLGSAQALYPPRSPERSVFIDKALDLEKQQLWQQAADLYQRALRRFPNDPDIQVRYRTAEQLYSLSRRYHDPSFQRELLVLPEPQSLALYREVLEKIRSHYVRSIPLREQVLAGYRSLLVALERPVFVETNFVGVDDQKRRVLIERLHQASGRLVDIGTVDHAVAEARNVVRLCSVHGCQHRSAAVMEFVCGACESLDPYTTHLTPHRLDELYSMIDGSFVGLGVEVRGDGRGLKIVSVLPDSPASVAGLDEGTSILAVDGVDLAGLNTEDAANRLQGPVGSVVRLRVAGADERARELAVTRREVIVHSVRDARLLEGSPGVGYVRIESFQKNTREELASLVSDLERSGARSLVIDLRGNPGGLLDVSLEAANLFVDHGVLVSTRGRAWGQNWEHRARSLPIHHLPIAVLVDSESASASEIFAAAIQDHHRGRVVGTRTYGKGSVQSIFPLTLAGTGLRLTTAHFFSPKGKRLQGVGVEPDLSVVRGEDEMGQELPVPRVPTLENDPQLRLAAEQIGQTLAVRSAN